MFFYLFWHHVHRDVCDIRSRCPMTIERENSKRETAFKTHHTCVCCVLEHSKKDVQKERGEILYTQNLCTLFSVACDTLIKKYRCID